MARQADPDGIVEEFLEELESIRDNFAKLIELTEDDGLLKELAIDTFLRVAVAFETFRSDWHIAAINRDASVFIKTLNGSVKGTVAGARDYRGAAEMLLVSIKKNPSVPTIRKIVDPNGRNLTFGDTDGWQKRARRELGPKYEARVAALTADDMNIVTAVVGIRNCLSHRSAGSVADMNAALQKLPAGLRRPRNRVSVKGIGAYLWASQPGKPQARAIRFLNELRRLARVLKTPP